MMDASGRKGSWDGNGIDLMEGDGRVGLLGFFFLGLPETPDGMGREGKGREQSEYKVEVFVAGDSLTLEMVGPVPPGSWDISVEAPPLFLILFIRTHAHRDDN